MATKQITKSPQTRRKSKAVTRTKYSEAQVIRATRHVDLLCHFAALSDRISQASTTKEEACRSWEREVVSWIEGYDDMLSQDAA